MGISEPASDWTWEVDVAGVFTYAGPRIEGLLGYTPEEVVGKTPFDFMASHEATRATKVLKNVVRNGDPVMALESVFLHKDGHRIILETDGMPVLNEAGKVIFYRGVSRNIANRKRAEEKDRKQKYYLEKAQELGQIGTWEIDLKHDKIYWTEENCRIFGAPADSVVTYEVFLEKVHPDDRDFVDLAWKAAIDGKPYDIEHRIVVDGVTAWVREKAEVMFDEDGSVISAIGITQDITGRKRTEELLRRNESFIRTVLDNLPMGIAVNTVSPEVVFSYMNDNFAKNYRTTKEALSDPDVFWDSVYEDSEFREEMTARVLSDCDSGDPERMHWEDIPITRRGQETAYITARNIPVPDENMMISIVWDVTDRKRVEEAIRESEATLKGILDNVGIGIALIGKEMQVLSLNRTMQEWFPSIDVSDTPICYNVYNDPPRDTPCSYCPTILTLADGKVHEAVTETPTGEGMRHYRIVSSPLLDAQGNIIAAIEMVDDITDRMQVETDRRKLETQLHQSQKMDAIGQLAAGVAHDFNNLLGGIMGYADLLMMDLLPGSSEANYTEEILKASSRAADLTRQLLTFSRKGRMQTADVDVHSVIDEVISLLSRSIDKSIEIAQQLEASPSVVSGDATELQGAVLNLAINARDAMPDGGQLTFTTRTLLIDEHYCAQHADDISPGLYVEIAVSDTGVGMDADVKQHLFEPFFTTKEQGKGTGLGLAGVYGCVKDHLGAIRVYSKLGLGSTVKMLLPVCAEATAVTAAVTQAPVYGHGHILVIDDEKVVRRFTSTALTHLGYRVSCCCNGEEGVAFFRDHHTEVDLVILDMIMPKLNGEEAFRLLKEIDPDVRVLIASGFAPNYTSKTVIDAGALGFLPKPFLVETLSYEIARCLSART